jgi:hypothetical protein
VFDDPSGEKPMSAEQNYLAIYLGSPTSASMTAWNALSEAERLARQQEGMAAWHGWMQTHAGAVVVAGGPLGKTKRVTGAGVNDVSNPLSGYVVVRAASHEAAAKLFEDHPHFSIFPGEAVEVMPVMAIPGA